MAAAIHRRRCARQPWPRPRPEWPVLQGTRSLQRQAGVPEGRCFGAGALPAQRPLKLVDRVQRTPLELRGGWVGPLAQPRAQVWGEPGQRNLRSNVAGAFPPVRLARQPLSHRDNHLARALSHVGSGGSFIQPAPASVTGRAGCWRNLLLPPLPRKQGRRFARKRWAREKQLQNEAAAQLDSAGSTTTLLYYVLHRIARVT